MLSENKPELFGPQEPARDQEVENLIVVFEFKIEGMTCVACSSAIERGLTFTYKDKGLVQDPEEPSSGVAVALLMHKMRISFFKEQLAYHKITAENIIEEVEDLGFGASLLNMFEISNKSEQGSIQVVDEETGDKVVKMVG